METVEFAVVSAARQTKFSAKENVRRSLTLVGNFNWLTQEVGSGIARISQGDSFSGVLSWRFPFRLYVNLPTADFADVSQQIFERGERLCSVFFEFEYSGDVDWTEHADRDWPLTSIQISISEKADD